MTPEAFIQQQAAAAVLALYGTEVANSSLQVSVTRKEFEGTLKMSANLENSTVATGLEKVNFHSNPKEGQCQRMCKLPHDCTHLT